METLKQKLYKVIATSNFNDQSVSDLLIKDNLTKEMADRIVKDHNYIDACRRYDLLQFDLPFP